MNLDLPTRRDLRWHPAVRAWLGFTITELMVSTAVLMLVLAGVIGSHLYGVRMYEIAKVKLGAGDEARSAISLLISELRSAKIIRIGTGGLTSFNEIPPNTRQAGSAIQVYATTNTNSFVRYYWDASDRKLKRTTNGSSAVLVVANYISNNSIFTAEDHLGTVLSNNQNNRVIGMMLQFYQIEFPVVRIGPGNYFDYYQLHTRVTRRVLE